MRLRQSGSGTTARPPRTAFSSLIEPPHLVGMAHRPHRASHLGRPAGKAPHVAADHIVESAIGAGGAVAHAAGGGGRSQLGFDPPGASRLSPEMEEPGRLIQPGLKMGEFFDGLLLARLGAGAEAKVAAARQRAPAK